MLCQNCGKNEASIHLYANVNGQRKQLDYCQSCYQKLKAQSGNPTNMMARIPSASEILMTFFDKCLAKCNKEIHLMNKRLQLKLEETA